MYEGMTVEPSEYRFDHVAGPASCCCPKASSAPTPPGPLAVLPPAEMNALCMLLFQEPDSPPSCCGSTSAVLARDMSAMALAAPRSDASIEALREGVGMVDP